MSNNSKKDNISDFFEKMKLETEKERSKSNKSLSDYTNSVDDFKTGTFKIEFEPSDSDSDPLNEIKSKVQNADYEQKDEPVEKDDKTPAPQQPEKPETLLQRCKQYTYDEDGNDCSVDDSSLYELKSVAEILKNDSLGALENLSKKYNITITNETSKSSETDDNNIPNAETSKNKPDVKEDVVKEDIVKEDIKESKLVEDATITLPDISDIDNSQKLDVKSDFEYDNDATIKFVPVKDNGDKPTINLSSSTGTFNVVKNKAESKAQNTKQTKLENDDFDDYVSNNEIEKASELKSAYIGLSKKKRLNFISTSLSVVCLLTLLVFRLPVIFDNFSVNIGKAVMLLLIVFAVDLISNIDVFYGIKNAFNRFANPDVSLTVSLAAFFAVSIIQINNTKSDYVYELYYLLLTISFVLLMRSISKYKFISSKQLSLKVLCGKQEKNAVTLINDSTVTHTMAKNSIDGDVLLTASRKTSFVSDFSKYFDYNTILNGKFKYFQIVGIIISIIFSLLSILYFENIIVGLLILSVVTVILSLPTSYFINSLPLSAANKKLNEYGAMINGVQGAIQIENSNAVVVSSGEIFPAGSILLKNLKVLSDNNIDDTFLKAASLTESVGSTWAPIFKQIAKSNDTYILPDSDTVKYEDKMGLSGWVDNELLFIGNRTLLESHGISVPDVEVDHQILKNGCFPIYLATAQKACALLIVKYTPLHSVSKELQRITNLGVTLLVTNHDPNINEMLLSDYFGIYDDSVKIVNNPGMSIYNKATAHVESMSAPAVYKNKNLSIIRIMNLASSIKKSNTIFTFLYVVFSVLMIVSLIYTTFAINASMPSMSLLILLEVIVTAISFVIYLFKKP